MPAELQLPEEYVEAQEAGEQPPRVTGQGAEG